MPDPAQGAVDVSAIWAAGPSVVIGLFVKEWISNFFEKRKRGSGNDDEYAQKQATRMQIMQLTDDGRESRESMGHIADALRDAVRELAEMRRESRESHSRIEAALSRRGP